MGRSQSPQVKIRHLEPKKKLSSKFDGCQTVS
jgi:hypothetical protein